MPAARAAGEAMPNEGCVRARSRGVCSAARERTTEEEDGAAQSS